MSVQELIQQLRTESLRADRCTTQIMDLCMEAAEILECVFSRTEDGEINLCLCCEHIAHMDRCKMDVGCSRCGETECPCQNCHGGSNWELLDSKISDKGGLTAKPDTPLTIEQLRKMRGKWVWIVSPDKDLTVSGWAYVGKDHVYTYWEYERDELVGRVVYNICDYGAWLAYKNPSVGNCEELDLFPAMDMQEDHRWIPCSSGIMPGAEQEVRVACKTSTGYRYQCLAVYIPTGVYREDSGYSWDWECCEEYDEERDDYMVNPGWYESIHNWDDYNAVGISDTVTHWIPLPQLPKEVSDNG